MTWHLWHHPTPTGRLVAAAYQKGSRPLRMRFDRLPLAVCRCGQAYVLACDEWVEVDPPGDSSVRKESEKIC